MNNIPESLSKNEPIGSKLFELNISSYGVEIPQQYNPILENRNTHQTTKLAVFDNIAVVKAKYLLIIIQGTNEAKKEYVKKIIIRKVKALGKTIYYIRLNTELKRIIDIATTKVKSTFISLDSS